MKGTSAGRPFFLLTLLLFSYVHAQADELWQRAVDYFEKHRDLVPGRMEIRFDQYNGRGKLLSAEFSEIEIVLGADGELESRTVFASRNGEIITEERQSDGPSDAPFGGSGDNDRDSPFAGLSLSPFDPEEQKRVETTNTGASEEMNGSTAVVYTYRHWTGEKNGMSGVVWIDQENGAPVRLSAVIEPLPGYVDEFVMIQDFALDSDGRWFLSRMEFVGEGNILFVRRRIESKLAFSDYFDPSAATVN